jgi:hypothetical protein
VEDKLVLSSPSTPHILELFLLTLRVRQVLRESLRRKLDHSRCTVYLGIKDAQEIRGSDTCSGSIFGCEEDAFTERRESLDVQVLVAFGV